MIKGTTPQFLHIPHPHFPLFSFESILQSSISRSKTFLSIMFFFRPVLHVIFLTISLVKYITNFGVLSVSMADLTKMDNLLY